MTKYLLAIILFFEINSINFAQPDLSLILGQAEKCESIKDDTILEWIGYKWTRAKLLPEKFGNSINKIDTLYFINQFNSSGIFGKKYIASSSKKISYEYFDNKILKIDTYFLSLEMILAINEWNETFIKQRSKYLKLSSPKYKAFYNVSVVRVVIKNDTLQTSCFDFQWPDIN